MLSIQKFSLCLLLASITVVPSGCSAGANEYRFEKDRRKIEDNTPPFNPAYFKKADSKHISVFFDIVEGELILSKKPAQVRPGQMPYRSKTAGSVLVIYKGADGKELGRYATEDPALARSCDFEAGKKGNVKPIERGRAEILLPYDPKITTLEIGLKEGKKKTFNIGSQVNEGLRGERQQPGS